MKRKINDSFLDDSMIFENVKIDNLSNLRKGGGGT
jgi:UDP-3-O-[3-hydroxymyristoyl] glucosamine N-acyltransferase